MLEEKSDFGGMLFSYKKKEGNIAVVTTWMDLEGIMLSEISQTEKDKYCMITDMWNLKELNSETQSILVAARGWKDSGKGHMLVKEYKLPVMR